MPTKATFLWLGKGAIVRFDCSIKKFEISSGDFRKVALFLSRS